MNREQYPDPTAEQAIGNVMREGRRRQEGNRYSGRCVRVWRREAEKNFRENENGDRM